MFIKYSKMCYLLFLQDVRCMSQVERAFEKIKKYSCSSKMILTVQSEMYRHYLETETIQFLKVGNAVRVKVTFLSSVAQFLLAIVKQQLN